MENGKVEIPDNYMTVSREILKMITEAIGPGTPKNEVKNRLITLRRRIVDFQIKKDPTLDEKKYSLENLWDKKLTLIYDTVFRG